MRPLSRWALDVFLILFAIAEAVALVLSAGAVGAVGAILAVLSAAALIARRINPLWASIASIVLLGGCLYLMGEAPTIVFFGLLVTFAIVAAINSTRDAVIAWLVGASGIGLAVWLSAPADPIADFGTTLALCTVMWTLGLLLSRRTRQASLMATKLEVTELERARAILDERSRIARELHDIVSHGLTVVVVQTLAARSVLDDLPPAEAAEADRHMAAVEVAAREALADMRRMLGLLQSVDDDSALLASPSPRLRDLGALFDRARAAGLTVDDHRVETGSKMSLGLEQSVYRIVQEALTNAIKHAPASRVTVRVAREGDDVQVEVTDDGGGLTGARVAVPASGAILRGGGRGLIGMRERASAFSGSLRAEPMASGGFLVRAVLPIAEDGGA